MQKNNFELKIVEGFLYSLFLGLIHYVLYLLAINQLITVAA